MMDQTDFLRFDLSEHAEAVEAANRFGIQSYSPKKGNLLFVHSAARAVSASLHFEGEGNEVVIDQNCAFRGQLIATGNGSKAMIGGGQHTLNLGVTLYDYSNLELGFGTVAYGLRVWVSTGRQLKIGERCLFSEGVTVRTTDHHSIFDIDLMEQLNEAKDVTLEPDVWIGYDVAIMKGVVIGRGSIVGAKSVVNGPVPAFELWAGCPARMIRRRVSWLDPHPATPDQIRSRMTALGLLEAKIGIDVAPAKDPVE